MTISEMLVREDIYGIIEKTLEEYYTAVYSDNVSVRVEKSVLKNRFVVYPRLGVIVSRMPSWKVMVDIYKQFDVQHNILRKIVAWGYITICFATFGLLASRSLYLSKKNYLKGSRYIMPCNRKLRIFYYDKEYVDAILKVGFSDAYFKNEIKYRTNPLNGFIPPIIQSGERWYREEILYGYGLVRTHEPQYSKGVNSVLDGLKFLYTASYHCTPAKEYFYKLKESIINRLEILETVKHVPTIPYIKSVVEKAEGIISTSRIQVPLILSHGDLQTGNIFVDKKSGKVVVYDWETAGSRSIWYDMGRLLLYSQRKGRYAEMVEGRNNPDIKSKILYMDSEKDYPMDEVISILVMEELVAFAEEICELPGSIGVEIMDRLTDELQQTELFKA